MNAVSFAITCWRHGTTLEIKATGIESALLDRLPGTLIIKVQTCPDCKREGRLSGYNEARSELIPEVGSREWMEDQLPP